MSDDSTRIKTLENVVGLHYNDFRCRLLCNDSAFVATRHRKSPKTRSSWERRVSIQALTTLPGRMSASRNHSAAGPFRYARGLSDISEGATLLRSGAA